MTEVNIIRALDLMGVVGKPRPLGNDVMCRCVLHNRHQNGDRKASLSIKINDNGQSVVYYYGCKIKSTMVGLAYEFERSIGCGNVVKNVRALEYGGVYKPLFKKYDSIKHLRHRNYIADIWLARRDKLDELDVAAFDDCFGTVPKYIIDARGIDIDTIKRWRIGYWRRGRQGVFFPVFDSDKRMVGYIIRWVRVKEDENKYFIMPGMKKKKILYGENMIDKEKSNKFVIIEGAIDALKVWMAGYNPLSPCGGDFSDNQVSKVINLCSGMEGYVMGDGDRAGRLFAVSIVDKFKNRDIVIRDIELNGGRDPGDMKPEEIRGFVERWEK
jgi:hypothetical protein